MESWREQDRTRDATKHAKLVAARDEVSVVATDHIVLSSGNTGDLRGTSVAQPFVSDVVDETLFNDLKTIGLRDADARHFMYASKTRVNGSSRSIPDFLGIGGMLSESRCPNLKVVKPSELATELRNTPKT